MSKPSGIMPSPERYPFFYGWVIVAVGTMGIVLSIPGQTMGVSVFMPRLAEALRLSPGQLSIAYGVGTVSSGLLLTRAGRLVDRFGVQRGIVVAALCFGVALLFISACGVIVDAITSVLGESIHTAIAIAVAIISFFLIRFLGQGMLAMIPRVMIGKWFNRRRGLAVGVSGIFASFGFGTAPLFLNMLLQAYGWRGAYMLLALIVGAGLSLIGWLFYREQPEDFGLHPDGIAQPKAKESKSTWTVARDFTVEEARRSYEFWIYTFGLASQGLIITGLTFYIIPVTLDAGLTETEGLSIFLPMAVVSVISNVTSGWIADKTKLKYLLIVQMAALTLATVSMVNFGDPTWRLVAIFCFGISGGLFNNLMGTAWARFFGTLHLGGISGQNMAITVLITSVGPIIFAASYSLTEGYAASLLGLACLPALVFVLAFFSGNPQDRPH